MFLFPFVFCRGFCLYFCSDSKGDEKPQSWSVVKCWGMILRRWGGVVSSSLHKPSAADMGVVRGVTEHSKWTSQTLREAVSGLPLMLPDLASGTERKCCRTRREHRRSRQWSACQPADCGKKRESEGRQKRGSRVPQEGDIKNKGGKERNKKEREKDYTFPLTQHVFSCYTHESSILPSLNQISPLPFPIKKSSLFTLAASLHCLSNDPSVLPSLLHGQLNVRPIGQGVNGAAARALQLNNVWQGTNSTGRGDTATEHWQRPEESGTGKVWKIRKWTRSEKDKTVNKTEVKVQNKENVWQNVVCSKTRPFPPLFIHLSA